MTGIFLLFTSVTLFQQQQRKSLVFCEFYFEKDIERKCRKQTGKGACTVSTVSTVITAIAEQKQELAGVEPATSTEVINGLLHWWLQDINR